MHINVSIFPTFSQLTQPIDDVSSQETCGTKHRGSYSAKRGASSFPFRDESMVQLPLLDCGDRRS